jgi:predicted HTH domain antitoxin
MKLLVFAHRGEAKSFLSRLDLKENKIGPITIFSNESTSVLICGQGLKNADKALFETLEVLKDINLIINLGICGSLKDSIKLNNVYKVKTSLNFKDDKILSLVDKGVDCISTSKIINSSEGKLKLSKQADIVDMELYAIASISNKRNIPFHSYKLAADPANEDTKCRTIKQNAKLYSDKLFEFYHENIK